MKSVSEPANKNNRNIYYGVNVSPHGFEPLDQLDGFLVAKYLQKRYGGNFYVYIAGCYNILNASTPKEARAMMKEQEHLDNKKSEMLSKVFQRLELSGGVLTTKDLWSSIEYWQLFEAVLLELDKREIEKRIPPRFRREAFPMKDFPRDIIYAGSCINFDSWMPSALYIPLEVAESLWFREKYSVGWKIGPADSESIYDDIIQSKGIGIIGMTQPEYIDNDGCVRNTVPYIGKTDQEFRFFFFDRWPDIRKKSFSFNPSFKRICELVDIYSEMFGCDPGSPSTLFKLANIAR